MADKCEHKHTLWDDDDPALLCCADCGRAWRLDGDQWVRDRLLSYWWRRVTANV